MTFWTLDSFLTFEIASTFFLFFFNSGIEAEYTKHAVHLLLECLCRLVDSLLSPITGWLFIFSNLRCRC